MDFPVGDARDEPDLINSKLKDDIVLAELEDSGDPTEEDKDIQIPGKQIENPMYRTLTCMYLQTLRRLFPQMMKNLKLRTLELRG